MFAAHGMLLSSRRTQDQSEHSNGAGQHIRHVRNSLCSSPSLLASARMLLFESTTLANVQPGYASSHCFGDG